MFKIASKALLSSMLLFITCISSSNQAQAKDTVVVFPLSTLGSKVTDQNAQQMTSFLVNELKQRDEFDVLEGQESTANTTTKKLASSANYKKALELLDKSQQAFDRFRFDAAINSLKQAITLFENNLLHASDYSKIQQAYLLLTVAHFRRGQETQGREYLERFITNNPTYQLDRKKYPPLFLSIFDQIRQKTISKERGSLQVLDNSGGSNVYLNGRSLGQTPLVVHEILEGQHHLRVVHDKNDMWGGIVSIQGNKTARKKVDVGPLPIKGIIGASLSQNTLSQAARSRASAIARKKSAKYVVLGSIYTENNLFTVPLYVGNTVSGNWYKLLTIKPDLDMLGASIEAYKFAEALVQLGSQQTGKKVLTGDVVIAPSMPTSRQNTATKETVFISPQLVAQIKATAPRSSADKFTGFGSQSRAPIRPVIPSTNRTPIQPVKPIESKPRPKPTPQPLEISQPKPAESPLPKIPLAPIKPHTQTTPPAAQPVRAPISRGSTRAPISPNKTLAARPTDESEKPDNLGIEELTMIPAPQAPPLATRQAINLTEEASIGQIPIWEQWWFWTVAGVVVTGATVGITVWAIGRSQDIGSAKIVAVW